MSLKSYRWIKKMVHEYAMIIPFVTKQTKYTNLPAKL